MRPALSSAALALLLATSALTALACTGKAPDPDAAAGCAKDTDCKGDRVCVSGSCQQAPAAATSAAPTQAPSASAAPTATQAPSDNPFRAVPEAEWKPVLGPRLRRGAVVAHQVFEGPFGPSPKGLLVITREGAEFFATVWTDGHGYRSTALANNGATASKIPAVSFFDADGDGSTDVLIMATYTPPGGGADVYENVLLRWKGTSPLRMPGLEAGIARLETVAAVRAKLKK